MAKTKAIVISKPMDAIHVGGVNVMASSGSNLHQYFPGTAIIPDERPSHTFVAIGKTEAHRRADTIASTIRRPSLSFKRSLSRLRRKSVSHHPGARRGSEEKHRVESQLQRPDNTTTHRLLAMQPSTSMPRRKVALDRHVDGMTLMSQSPTPEAQGVLEPMQDTSSEPRDNGALARLTTTSSMYTTATDVKLASMNTALPRRPVANQQSSLSSKHTPPNAMTFPSRSHGKLSHVDSSTAIDIRGVPIEDRPVPFKDIMAVSSLAERMAMYKKTRDYWATTDHELVEWVQRAAASKTANLQA